MRTNIVIDDKLMKETLKLTGLKTKREAVELGLRTLVRLRKQDDIRRFRGKLKWHGDLDAMRTEHLGVRPRITGREAQSDRARPAKLAVGDGRHPSGIPEIALRRRFI
jgi:Arc/MetJ family transcription regulator